MATQTLPERTAVLATVGLTPLLTTAQLTAYYGVSAWTVNQWVQRGCPTEPVPVRGHRFNLDRVAAWIAEDIATSADAESA
ncbi:hypothetical protein FCH28_09555 [Streptomyces piniterrae]|uniref:DNA-binding protein n=1 Tax=Streptomyces piniterrae TaxID=2571125 RepID=A0A4U0NMI6_9ACTN|nr:hypothetical protein [Streptomyces piniterrae]TJZ55577.1 hypothetical protein FCH28_09555 [Streptomyces piniterrae]